MSIGDDVYRCILSILYELCKQMESDGNLDRLNNFDIFCLHLVFLPLPRINGLLQEFMESWNNHCEGNYTPNQLYVRGFLQQGSTPA